MKCQPKSDKENPNKNNYETNLNTNSFVNFDFSQFGKMDF